VLKFSSRKSPYNSQTATEASASFLSFNKCCSRHILYQWTALSLAACIIIIIIIIRHAPCPLATNSLHSDLSKASSIASSKVRLCRDRSLFRVAIQVSGRPTGLLQSLWWTPVRILLASAVSSILATWPNNESSFLYDSREGRLLYAVPLYASLRGWKRGGTGVYQGSSSGTTDPVYQSFWCQL